MTVLLMLMWLQMKTFRILKFKDKPILKSKMSVNHYAAYTKTSLKVYPGECVEQLDLMVVVNLLFPCALASKILKLKIFLNGKSIEKLPFILDQKKA